MNLVMTRGDNLTENIPLTKSGQSLDVSAAQSLRFTAKARVFDAEPVITKSLSDGIIALDAAQGLMQLQIDPSDTAGLPPNVVLLWDIELVEASGVTTTVASGDLLVRGDVSTPDVP